MLAVTWLNSQIIFDGLVQGLGVAVIAVGVVLVYRATRIINFAVGNMGVVGAAVLSLLVVQYHVQFWIGLVVALILGLAFGAVGGGIFLERERVRDFSECRGCRIAKGRGTGSPGSAKAVRGRACR